MIESESGQTSDDKSESELYEDPFTWEDIKDELAYFEKAEMSSFQKINLFFNSIST